MIRLVARLSDLGIDAYTAAAVRGTRVAPCTGMPLVRRIVVGTDFSRGSNRAVLYAAELAKALDASLTVLHVDEKAAFVPGSDLAEREGRADRAQMDALVRQLAGRHVAARGVVRPGIPPEGLCDYARGEQADLLVIGAQVR